MVRESEFPVDVQEAVYTTSRVSTPLVGSMYLHRVSICRMLDCVRMDVPPSECLLQLWYAIDGICAANSQLTNSL